MIFASNNKGKIKEIQEILADYEIKSLNEANINIEVEEDQDTFYGNALKKAKEIYDIAKEPVLADDSGLCIKELDNWPGVLTHRFLGEGKSDRERNLTIIDKVANECTKQDASVICNLVYYDGVKTLVGVGEIIGKITKEPRGSNGFGFDEIFEYEGTTLAEMSKEEKNNLSARSLAAKELKKQLEK